MKRYQGYLFKQAVEELTRKIAAEFSTTIADIHWIAGIPTAGTDTYGDVYFADVADDAVLYDIDVQRYVGFAVHELLHRKYTNFSVNDDDQYIKQLHNACEDAWIEHTGIDQSLTGNIGSLLTALLDQIVGEANATVTDWSDPAQYPFIFAVYLRRHINCHVPVPEGIEWIIHQASNDILTCKSTADTLRLAQWIMAQLNGLPKNPQQPGDQTPQPPQQGGKQGGSRLDGNPFNRAGQARAPGEGTEAVEVEPTLKKPDGKGGIGSWCEGAEVGNPLRHLSNNPWMTERPAVPGRLRYEVKRLFDNSGMEEFQRNRRSGAVNVNALHKVGVTDKLFQRRHEADGIDSAVVICLDVSASMFDDGKHNEKYGRSNRIVQAILTAEALLETLQKSQVATCVLTFGGQTAVMKPFSEHPVKAARKLESLTDGGGTNDYFAVRYAHKLLLNRPEQRKIAFVITDGIGRPSYVRRQCESGERLGITTIGIGIEQRVDGIYPNAIHVNDVTELGSVSFKQIKLAV